MQLAQTTQILAELAATQISAAGLDFDPDLGDIEGTEIESYFAAHSRHQAGTFIAAINHMNGVSPE
jgi:hypothetical protein